MDVRKIAAIGGLAAGAALVFAPLAAADPAADAAAATDPVTALLPGEAASLNSQFEFDALLTGNYSDLTLASSTNPFDIVTPADVTAVQGTGTTPFDYLVYGADPTTAGLATDPGSYNIFNGAEAKFIDAYNEAVYGAANSNAVDPTSADFIGSPTSIADASGMANAADAVAYYYNFALGDLYGDLGLPAADYANFTSAFDITAAQASEFITLLGSL